MLKKAVNNGTALAWEALQDCFDFTDWQVLTQAARVEDATDASTEYVVPTKTQCSPTVNAGLQKNLNQSLMKRELLSIWETATEQTN